MTRPTDRRRAGASRPDLSPTELLGSRIGSSGIAGAATLRRVGPRLGIETVRDLLFHLPRRYEDLRELRRLGDLVWVADGTPVSARVIVTDIRVEPTFRRRVQRTVARLEDPTGTVDATWFGRRFIERRLRPGQAIVVSGKVKHLGHRLTFDNPEFSPDDGSELLHAGRIVPIYRLTAGLTGTRLRASMRDALDRAGAEYPEYLAPATLAEEDLVGIATALEAAHFPAGFDARDAALRRLAFDELLALQIGMVERRRQRGRASALAVATSDDADMAVRASIAAAISRRTGRPIALTDDQDRAMDEIRADLGRPVPMLRLVQGDVGSGKTAVAAHAMALVAGVGRQAALLAPTDLLARQHAETLGALLEGVGLGVTLLTATLSADGRRRALESIGTGQAGVVVGTHALLQGSVAFADLGLVVVDEQHRFGVEQRGLLEDKSPGLPPHVLLMTATPIPRTLGQVLYADLDVSDLHAAPEGRVPVRTAIRRPDELERLWTFVRAQAEAGHRTFVVVPLIDEPLGDEGSDDGVDPQEAGAVAAEAEATRLRTLLAPLEVGMVHGRMRPADRDAEMARFRDGDLQVLVGTTVIEVGVDVPEATVMIIEGADRFGLAQLHQLRGRVGRGTEGSFCVLVSAAQEGTTAWERLKAVERLRDGFDLAEEDFALRGEGDVLGLVQSGLPPLRVASMQRSEHRELAVRARSHAERLVDERGDLRSGDERLGDELRGGWLARVWSGDPASGA